MKAIPLETRISNFKNAIGGACRKIEDAARQYALAMRDFPREAPLRFREILPQMSPSGWDKLLKIGNGGANPNVMWLSDIAANRVIRLPIEDQNRLLDGFTPNARVEIVDRTTGEPREKKINSLQRKDLDVLIDGETNTVRTRAQQEAYVKSLRTKAPTGRGTALYHVEGNVLVVSRAGRITKAELISILKDMAK